MHLASVLILILTTVSVTNADDEATVTAEYEDAKKSVEELKASINAEDAADLPDVEKERLDATMGRLVLYLDESKKKQHHSPGHFARFSTLTRHINGKLQVNLKPSSGEEIALELAKAMTYVSVAIPGPLGIGLSTLSALLVHMMEIGNPDLTVAGIVNNLLKKHFAFNEFQEIAREVKGFAAMIDSLQMSIRRVEEYGVNKLSDVDLQRFLVKFDIDIEKQLGELEQYITSKAKTAKNDQDVSYVLQASRMYAQLGNLDRILRHELRAVLGVDTRTNFTVIDIAGAIQVAENRAKNVFKFLENPTMDELVTAINLNKAKYDILVQFLISVGVNPFAQQQELTDKSKCYRIRGVYWSTWYVTRSNTGDTTYQARLTESIDGEGNRGKFKFQDSGEDYVKILSRDPDDHEFAVCTTSVSKGATIRLALLKPDAFADCKNRFRFMKLPYENGGFKWYLIEQSRGFEPLSVNGHAVSPMAEPGEEGDQFWKLEEIGC